MDIEKLRCEIKLSVIVYIDSITDNNTIVRKKQYHRFYEWAKKAIDGDWKGYNFDSIALLAVRQCSKYNICGLIGHDTLSTYYQKFASHKNIMDGQPVFADLPFNENQVNFFKKKESPKLLNPYIFIGGIVDFISWYELNKNNLNDAISKAKTELSRFNKNPSNPTVATFCLVIFKSEHYKNIGLKDLVEIGYTKEPQLKYRGKFIMEVCKHYDIQYKERMSKSDWSETYRSRYYNQIKELLYPKIDKQTMEAIEIYINSMMLHN